MNGNVPAAAAATASRLRVLMFDTLSGTNDYSNELIEALVRVPGLDLTVLTVECSRLPADIGCRVLRLMPDFGAPESKATKLRKLLRAYAALGRLALERPRETVLHVQFFKFAWVEAPALLLLRLLGLRVVFTAHNALPHVRKSWHRGFYRTWYGLIDGVHVLSAPVARDIREDLGARPRVLRQIGHGPYETLRRRFGPGMERGAARARLGVPAQAFVVLQYGLFRGYKGVDVLLSALCAMPRDAQVHLLLAGGGYPADLARFKAIAEQADRLGDVTWLERFVTDQELCDCIAAADLVAFPYRWVSQSGALYLALTFGKPCIASDLPGFRDSLPDQQDCCFEVGNAAVLAQRILDLKDDPARLQRLQDCIAAKSRVGFDWDVIARETAALYVQVRT